MENVYILTGLCLVVILVSGCLQQTTEISEKLPSESQQQTIQEIHYSCYGGDEYYECRNFDVSFDDRVISYSFGSDNRIYKSNSSKFSEEYFQLLINLFNKIRIKEDGIYYDEKCSEASYEERPRPLGEYVCSINVTYNDGKRIKFGLDHLACVEDKNILSLIDIIEKIVGCDTYMGHYYYLEEECKKFFTKFNKV